MDKKVFLSYANKDATYAKLLARTLKKKGIDVFIDQEFLTPGTDWAESLGKKLGESDAVITLLSDNWTESNYTVMEYGAAYALDKKIIPIVIDDIKRNIPIDLKRYATVNAQNEDLESVARHVEEALYEQHKSNAKYRTAPDKNTTRRRGLA